METLAGRRSVRSAAWSALALLGVTSLIAAALWISTYPLEPQPTFPQSYATWLTFERPRGHFVGDTEYHWCDPRNGGFWVVFRANGDWHQTGRPCWLHLLPTELQD